MSPWATIVLGSVLDYSTVLLYLVDTVFVWARRGATCDLLGMCHPSPHLCLLIRCRGVA
jgi:hypothetical protein